MALVSSSCSLKLQKAHPGIIPSPDTYPPDFYINNPHRKIKANGGVLVTGEKDAEICLIDHLKETPREGKLFVPSRT